MQSRLLTFVVIGPATGVEMAVRSPNCPGARWQGLRRIDPSKARIVLATVPTRARLVRPKLVHVRRQALGRDGPVEVLLGQMAST